MKKLIISFGILVSAASLFAQNNMDALRYSQPTIGGTARSVGMGGAFGALGSDFSCLSQNPAGLGLYRGSEFTFTPEFYSDNTTSRYSGNELMESKFNFNISNLGYVAAFNEENGILKGVNFGIGFNRVANFNKNTTIDGNNGNTSFADYMAGIASNSNNLDAFSTDLFYRAFLIDPVTNGGYELNSIFLDNTGKFLPVEQRISTIETGRINEWDLSLGFNINDMLYIGGSLGILPLRYNSEKHTKEYDENDRSFQLFDYYESLDVNGTGYTGKIGMIIRPVQLLRLGVAFHMPTSYLLHEEYRANIKSQDGNFFPEDGNGNPYDLLENDYRIISPAKAITSVGLILGKFMVIDGDVEFINYTGMRLHSSNDDFSDQNDLIKQIYRNTLNMKIGSELRLGGMYFRGGFGYYGSPYAANEENYDAYKLSYSCGFGVRDENYFFDIAYQLTNGTERSILYDVSLGGLNYTPKANIDTRTGRLMTTIGFKF